MTSTQRIAALPGQGLVFRSGDCILVVAGDDQPDTHLVEELIEAMAEVADPAGLRALARILLDADEPPAIGVLELGTADGSVFLFGEIDLVLPDQRHTASGAVLGAHHTIDTSAGCAIVGAGARVGDVPTWVSLGSGAVAGSGCVLFPAATDVASLAAATDEVLVEHAAAVEAGS